MNEMTEGIGGCLVIITFKKNIFQVRNTEYEQL